MNNKHRYELPLPLNGRLSDVFEALIDDQKLTAWFCEHAEVDATEGGAFRFWGRHTYGAPKREQATQKIVRIEPPNLLSFSWHLLERDSFVTWSLSKGESDDDTRITVEHEFEAMPTLNRAHQLVDDLWRIHLGNLCGFLNGESDMFRPDFTKASQDVTCEIVIDAPPARVFETLITPELIKQWFPAPDPAVEPEVGGSYGFGFSYPGEEDQMIQVPPMEILEFVQNEKLSISWPDWRGDPSVADQRVTWLLEDLGGRTRLTLVHTGFASPVDVSDYPFGWRNFLSKIGEVAANR